MELSAKQFYIHRNFINVYYYTYVALENWIANNIFRSDLSRVFLASNDYAFRRRFELTNMSQSFKDLEPRSLQFPFANYWPLNTGWVPDTRPAALNAAMIYRGIYEGSTKIKAIASTLEVPVTFYFDREDDARIAFDILYFKSFNEHHYEQEVPYGDNTLTVPIELEVKDLRFNPEFTESDWLKNNRIFTITASLALRSFDICPPAQPNIDLEIDDNGYLSDGTAYDDGRDRYFLTKTVVLNQFDYNDLLTTHINIDGTAVESMIAIDSMDYTALSSTTVKLWWTTDPEITNAADISKITIAMENRAEVYEVPPESSFYLLQDLQPSSTYRGHITFYSKTSSPLMLGFTVRTLDDENLPEDSHKDIPNSSLIGASW